MNRTNAAARRGLGCVTILMLSACSPWDPAGDGGGAQRNDQDLHKATVARLSTQADASTIYVAATAEHSAAISSPKDCGAKMGSGGNFTEGSFVLKGKCNGGGLSPRINHGQGDTGFLSFAIDPEQSVSGSRDRAELAFVRRYFPFHEPLFIGFRLMIPENVDATEKFFYALQLWQCAGLPPIAGVRVQRGKSHTINFMTRNRRDSRSRATFKLEPGRWHEFVLHMIPSPSDDALFEVFADGELLTRSQAAYGFGAADACGQSRNQMQYRVKFGIYKGGEPGKRFTVNYDDFTIAERYESVALALGWDPGRMLSAESEVAN